MELDDGSTNFVYGHNSITFQEGGDVANAVNRR